MTRILFLTFYFEPDLSAGSFRNTSLFKELIGQIDDKTFVDCITTSPNRYKAFKQEANNYEMGLNYSIRRIQVPTHQNGMFDQVKTYTTFFISTLKEVRKKQYDLVYASSSRLFTAFLGAVIANQKKAKLYLDIRDIFYDTMKEVLKGPHKAVVLPILKFVESFTLKRASYINLISPGFIQYFHNYHNLRTFTNGIDTEFIDQEVKPKSVLPPFKIIYAGNIGEGQGLHLILPELALELGSDWSIEVYGDGGTKDILQEKIKSLNVKNIILHEPVKRAQLNEIYSQSDYLFVHLNDYEAFKKVLPSKIFELAGFPKPIIAGVGGYAKKFISTEVKNSILFDPCSSGDLVKKLKCYEYKSITRNEFIDKFNRSRINYLMAQDILKLLK